MAQAEIETYPLTGRFLMGRLRHAMTADEKSLIESLIERAKSDLKAHQARRIANIPTPTAEVVIDEALLKELAEAADAEENATA